jgi:hypothetical protein
MFLEQILIDALLDREACASAAPATRSLTMDAGDAGAFAERTARSNVTTDDDLPAWLEHDACVLEAVAPDLTCALRESAARNQPVILVRGMPVDPAVAATPYDGIVDSTASHRAIVNARAVAGCLGLHPIAYAGESARVPHAVCPTHAARGQRSSHGFDAELPFHTDYADRPIDEPVRDQSPAATALIFAVERAEPAIPMRYVPTRRLLSELSAEQIRVGRHEEFAVAAPAIFANGHSPVPCRLFLPGGRCRLNLGTMTGLTDRATRLLRDIAAILADETLTEQIPVRRSDIVILDNQHAIHRRAAFAPRWDGTDRYFIRMSATPDPRAGIAADPCRPWLWS